MSLFPRLNVVAKSLGVRTISKLTFTDSTAYSSRPYVKKYLEERVKDICAQAGGLDSQGAIEAELTGTLHDGGTTRNEPYHAVIKFKNAQNKYIQTTDHLGRLVDSHHVIIDPDAATMETNAAAWQRANPTK